MIIAEVKSSHKHFEFTTEELNYLDSLRKKYKDNYSLTLPALWLVQNRERWISQEAMLYLEKILDIPVMHFYETASFFTMFDLKPRGKYYIKFCITLSCELRGVKDLIKHTEKRLGIKMGETTEDGLITLGGTECLGYCNEAPSLLCNLEQYKELDENLIDKILTDLGVKL